MQITLLTWSSTYYILLVFPLYHNTKAIPTAIAPTTAPAAAPLPLDKADLPLAAPELAPSVMEVADLDPDIDDVPDGVEVDDPLPTRPTPYARVDAPSRAHVSPPMT